MNHLSCILLSISLAMLGCRVRTAALNTAKGEGCPYTRTAKVGDPVDVRLNVSGGTNYRWSALMPVDHLTFKGVSHDYGNGSPGSAEADIFKFEAASKGTAYLDFNLESISTGEVAKTSCLTVFVK